MANPTIPSWAPSQLRFLFRFRLQIKGARESQGLISPASLAGQLSD